MPGHRVVLRWILVPACAAGAVIALAGFDTPLRPVLTGLFILLTPGVAVVGLLRDRDSLAAISTGVAASLVMNVSLATSMLILDAWSPRAGVATIAVLSGFIYVLRLLQPKNARLQTEQGAGSK
ncbi:hypothetical protein [Streptosporangium pseudovulgare]|uniref:DUF3147 domain-containing protein n=1 Tax=Streptosporangium pseudovulgare TaxID=35765 RepID=A0ABQ2QWB8_9ACTN|nr:hypothetical protein [Streptosporangium pseudovulgare]GGP99254.1 hypothetical protein GCM10010140_31590 [Streptosporangium pseudovulgare]